MKKIQDKGSGHRLLVLKTKSEASQNRKQFALFLEAIAIYVGTNSNTIAKEHYTRV